MKKTKEEINDYIFQNGWTGNKISWIGGSNNYEIRQWNKHKTNKKAYIWFKEHRNALFNSVKDEFQANHSAMSPEGAKAYADNWN